MNVHRFESAVGICVDDSTLTMGQAFRNDLKFSHLIAFAQVGTYYESEKWQIQLTIPFKRHDFRILNTVEDNREANPMDFRTSDYGTIPGDGISELYHRRELLE